MRVVSMPLRTHQESYLHLTAILIISEGEFQVVQRFSGSKLVLQPVKSRFVALNYYENGRICHSCKHHDACGLDVCAIYMVLVFYWVHG
jgi:hypothetical protein